MAGERVAWDYETSRQAWRSYRTAGLRWLGAGLICAVLVVAVAQFLVARSQSLLEKGAATTGTVRSADAQTVTFDYDAGGESFTGTLDVVSGREYAAGEEVEVRYDREDPGTARLLEEPHRLRGVGLALVVLSLVTAGAVPIGIGVLLRARAWGGAMRHEPWTLARLRMRGARVVLLPSDSGVAVHARMLSTTRWRTKAVLGMDGEELWMLPVGTRDLVVTADGTGTLYGLRRKDC